MPQCVLTHIVKHWWWHSEVGSVKEAGQSSTVCANYFPFIVARVTRAIVVLYDGGRTFPFNHSLTHLAPHSHMWGQSTQIKTSFPPKRGWRPKRADDVVP